MTGIVVEARGRIVNGARSPGAIHDLKIAIFRRPAARAKEAPALAPPVARARFANERRVASSQDLAVPVIIIIFIAVVGALQGRRVKKDPPPFMIHIIMICCYRAIVPAAAIVVVAVAGAVAGREIATAVTTIAGFPPRAIPARPSTQRDSRRMTMTALLQLHLFE